MLLWFVLCFWVFGVYFCIVSFICFMFFSFETFAFFETSCILGVSLVGFVLFVFLDLFL